MASFAFVSRQESLYCSEKCLRADTLRKHPSRGYTWHEFDNFLKRPKECQMMLLRPLDLLAIPNTTR